MRTILETPPRPEIHMRRFQRFARLPLATTFAIAPFVGLYAQGNTPTRPVDRPAASTPATAPALKTLNLEDYAGWNRIGASALSHDGKWMNFTYTPNEGGDPVLHVKALDGDKEYTIPLG